MRTIKAQAGLFREGLEDVLGKQGVAALSLLSPAELKLRDHRFKSAVGIYVRGLLLVCAAGGRGPLERGASPCG